MCLNNEPINSDLEDPMLFLPLDLIITVEICISEGCIVLYASEQTNTFMYDTTKIIFCFYHWHQRERSRMPLRFPLIDVGPLITYCPPGPRCMKGRRRPPPSTGLWWRASPSRSEDFRVIFSTSRRTLVKSARSALSSMIQHPIGY